MNQTDSHHSNARATIAHRLVLCSFYGFLLYFGVLSLSALDSIRLSTLAIWLLQTLALLPFAPGLHKRHRRSHLWLSLVILVYFIHGVLVAFAPGGLWRGGLQIGFCGVLFASLLTYVKVTKTASD